MWVERWCGGNVCDFGNFKATLFNGIGNMLDHVKPPQTHDRIIFTAGGVCVFLGRPPTYGCPGVILNV